MDLIQIKRWKAFGDRHGPAVKKIVKKEIYSVDEDKDKHCYNGPIILFLIKLNHNNVYIFFQTHKDIYRFFLSF